MHSTAEFNADALTDLHCRLMRLPGVRNDNNTPPSKQQVLDGRYYLYFPKSCQSANGPKVDGARRLSDGRNGAVCGLSGLRHKATKSDILRAKDLTTQMEVVAVYQLRLGSCRKQPFRMSIEADELRPSLEIVSAH